MGSQLIEKHLVFDTGSDWLVVEGHLCETCDTNDEDLIYDPSQSTESAQVGLSESERLYGSASLKGIEYTDTVCLDASTCAIDFEYFLITDQTGLIEPIDGIVGMSRNVIMEQVTPGPILVNELYQQSIID